MTSVERLFQALNQAEIRYVVVGGIATVLHGYARFTLDVDLVIDLEPAEAHKTIEALNARGFEPRLPVAARDFADPETRRRWIEEKGMMVFSMWDPGDPMLIVDLFVEHPIEFTGLWSRAQQAKLGSTQVRIASLEDLLTLKKQAGRPKDLEDVRQLERIARRREEPS